MKHSATGYARHFSGARGNHTQFSKKRPENAWANEKFHVGSYQFQESLRELLRELWFFLIAQVVRRHSEMGFRIPRIIF